jgi:ABC-type ATPase with predicted acetyltransferase domain
MPAKQSITRSLVELKTIDGRITKIIDGGVFMTYKTKYKNTRYNEEDFKKSATADFQSLSDLIKRRDQIKNAIVLSNASTMVEIAGTKMTVSQAIEFKNTINYKSAMLATLKHQRQMVIIEVDAHRQKVQNKVDENVRIICGKDAKPDAGTLKMVTDGIAAGDPIDVYDPLNIDKVIESLEREIEDFRANVDFVLSESNAITQIEV